MWARREGTHVPGSAEGTPQDVADACLARWKENYGTYPNDLTKPYPGIPALLAELRRRGCQVGCAVEQVRQPRAVHHEQVPLRCCGCAARGRRPAELPAQARPGGALTTIEELGSTPARTVYIGDSPGDIHVARNAGCYAVGVDWGYHDPADFAAEGWEPDLLVSDPEQILALAPEA